MWSPDDARHRVAASPEEQCSYLAHPAYAALDVYVTRTRSSSYAYFTRIANELTVFSG